ncbi:hypothetical protein L1987_47863 [Smallanthus sonchifolius]|uniref:Uncharacterized protein n=1 Tax=Smallanthus sonchifolius TaxID=185202 RepID=A0ACB9FQX7_9ASTR|nr:hypothetical protein L1987_47863 [Smallanthus sonchifolius]
MNQKGDIGKAFSKKEMKNTTKVKLWRKTLVDASMIAGWDPKNIANGHESKVIKEIVDKILEKLSPLNSYVDEHLVGMKTRLQDLKSRLEIGSQGVRMVGIWGVGGSGIEVLRQKALVTIVDGRIDMHDLIQEMGHNIVRGKHPKTPEKHSRVWKREEIVNMCFGDATMENKTIEAIEYDGYSCDHDQSSRFCKIVSNMKKLRWLNVGMGDVQQGGPSFLSNELRYIKWHGYPTSPFPDNFQPTKLVVLKLWGSMQKEVWKGCKYLPHLKVLQLRHMKKLLSTPDFNGLPCLQKLTLFCCYELEEIHPSIGNHTTLEYLKVSDCPKLRMFPTIIHMENLKTLEIEACFLEDGQIPSVFIHKLYGSDCVWISMSEVTSGMDYQDDVVWEESDRDKYRSTWVWYISFDSLKHTTWWDQTHKALLLNIEKSKCSGFGVRLIDKKSRSGLMGTSVDSSSDSDYTAKFKIEHDTRSALTISLTSYDWDLY